MRVLARDHDEVDDGWLCDKGRFAYQHVHADERIVQPLVREGTQLHARELGEGARRRGAARSTKAGGRGPRRWPAARPPTRRRSSSPRLFRDGLGSSHLCLAPGAASCRSTSPARSPTRRSRPRCRTSSSPTRCCCSTPTRSTTPRSWDLRIRKGVRRHGVRVGVVSARPTALDPHAEITLRHAPGRRRGAARRARRRAQRRRGQPRRRRPARPARAPARCSDLADVPRPRRGEDLVIVYGERLLAGPGGAQAGARAAQPRLAARARRARRRRPARDARRAPTARGLREAGFAPGHGPGYATLAEPGHGRGAASRQGLASAELSTVWLHHADPLRTHPDRAAWEAALGAAQTVIAIDSVLTDTIREHADVVFPAEAYAEKEGTLDAPRRARAAPAPGDRPPQGARPAERLRRARRCWQVIADVAARAGLELGVAHRPDGLAAAVRRGARSTRAHARRDRRPRACAGPPREAAAALRGRAVGAGEARRSRRPCRPAPGGRAAPGHLPLAVELQGGRRLAGAALPAPAPGRRALARRRRAARHPRGRPGRGGLQRHARARAP